MFDDILDPLIDDILVYVCAELLPGHHIIKQAIQWEPFISQLMNPCHGSPWHHKTNLRVAPTLPYFINNYFCWTNWNISILYMGFSATSPVLWLGQSALWLGPIYAHNYYIFVNVVAHAYYYYHNLVGSSSDWPRK